MCLVELIMIFKKNCVKHLNFKWVNKRIYYSGACEHLKYAKYVLNVYCVVTNLGQLYGFLVKEQIIFVLFQQLLF